MKFGLYVVLWVACLLGNSAWGVMPGVEVTAQEDVYSITPPNNGSGPLWSYGCTSIARLGNEVVVSQMETGKDVPLLCNTRWILHRRADGKWPVIAQTDAYRQREPCSLATLSDDTLFLYVNDSTQPPGTKYGPCHPHLLRFTLAEPMLPPTPLEPRWDVPTTFTDHSYRGYAADRANRRLMMLNIDAEKSTEHWCWMTENGEVLGNGHIQFPIRSCYPQVALVGNSAHVLAVGDIVEPVEEWRKYKFEQTKQTWDYVFRRLYYVQAANLKESGFSAPLEITNVDATGGYVSNQDLWIAPDGAAYILYTQREVQSALMRDKFFPGKSLIDSLYLAVVKDGQIVERRTLLAGSESEIPSCTRFHQAMDGSLYAFSFVAGAKPRNALFRIPLQPGEMERVEVPMEKPFTSFMIATVREGNAPSNIIDVLGNRDSCETLAYAQVHLK